MKVLSTRHLVLLGVFLVASYVRTSATVPALAASRSLLDQATALRDEAALPLDELSPRATEDLLDSYALEPRRGGHVLRNLVRRGLGQLPPAVLLAIADMQLRHGRLRSAEVVLSEAVAREPKEPWHCWAELGLGWIRLRAGENDEAREHFARAALAPGGQGQFGGLMLGLLDAAEGRSRDAVRVLTELAGDRTALPKLRNTARLAIGYSYYWAHAFSAAAAAFEEAIPALVGSVLADDARYAAALAHYHDGDVEKALAELDELAGQQGDIPGVRNTPLVGLDPHAMLRGTFTAYRQSTAPLRPPEAQATDLVNLDGVMLARTALRRLVNDRPLKRPVFLTGGRRSRPLRGGFSPVATHAGKSSVQVVGGSGAGVPSRVDPRSGSSVIRWGMLLLTIAAVFAVIGRRRTGGVR